MKPQFVIIIQDVAGIYHLQLSRVGRHKFFVVPENLKLHEGISNPIFVEF
jgi:hypothetical protein